METKTKIPFSGYDTDMEVETERQFSRYDTDIENVRLFSESHDFQYYDALSERAKSLFLNTITEMEKIIGHPTEIDYHY